MAKKRKLPRDVAQRAKAIVDIATGNAESEPDDGKNLKAIEKGRKGGIKGGKMRAMRLSPEKRAEIARKAAKARWSKNKAKKASAVHRP